MQAKTINQTIEFDASAEEVYEALMDSQKHSDFTGSPAIISRKEGGSFSAYEEYINGKNVKLEKNKKIVQSWTASDWPDNNKSTVTFELEEKDGKTILHFRHEGVPDDKFKDISDGWKEHYWDKMKDYLKRK